MRDKPDTVGRLRAALETEAAFAMTQTNTPVQLERFQHSIKATRRRRRRLYVASAVGVAAATTGIVVLAGSLGHDQAIVTPPVGSASPGPKAVSALPIGFPISLTRTLSKPIGTQPAGDSSLGFSDTGRATLTGPPGRSFEQVTFPRAGTIVFGTDAFFCTTPGTYRYVRSGATYTFLKVTDSCGQRLDFLVTGNWTVAVS